MLERLASACFRHRWRVIALWVVALVGLFAAKGAFGGAFADGGRLPGTDSQKAYDLAHAEMPNLTDDSATVVFHDAAGLDRPSTAAAIRSYLDQVRALPGISAVTSPFDAPEQRSADGTVAFATVELASDHPADTTAAAMAEKAKALQHPGLDVALGGYLFQDVAGARERGCRPAGRGDHPADRLRVGRRHGPADPHRDRRRDGVDGGARPVGRRRADA